MDFNTIKKQARLSDYTNANDILSITKDEGIPIKEAAAYIYRAGVQEGRAAGKRTQKRLAQALANAHAEIRALRKQSNDGKLTAILEAVKAVGNPVEESGKDVEA